MTVNMITSILSGLVIAWLSTRLYSITYNYFLHPLKDFPGPGVVVTGWYKTYQELFGRNWIDVLRDLHGEYGDVVRVCPNEVV